MKTQSPILLALAAIDAEIIRAFDWLAGQIDRRVPVTFVPNPGNIGDAAINIACFEYLKTRFDKVEICRMTDVPRTECVFMGGGGNAIKHYYSNVREFIDRLPLDRRLFMFSATIRGYSKSLQRVAPIARILCREPISHAFVAGQIGFENSMLTHDAAFLLAKSLWNDFAYQIAEAKTGKCRSFRADMESTNRRLSENDIMGKHYDSWTDMMAARAYVWDTASYLLDFDEVETDRLHCAILSAMLGRKTVLRANSYYKNAAVFRHSLSRLPNTTFVPAGLFDSIRSASQQFERRLKQRAALIWAGGQIENLQ